MTALTSSIVLNVILVIFLIMYLISDQKAANKKFTEQIKHNTKLLNDINYFIAEIRKVKTLSEVFILHIQIWASGIHSENFGPNEFGIFRTKDILKMKPEEVYLGNINGLWTKPLPFWEECSEEDYNSVLNQYKSILVSNMKLIRDELIKTI